MRVSPLGSICMARTPAVPSPLMTGQGLVAVAVVLAALAASVGALGYSRHSGQMVSDVELQTTITGAYQRRAVDCLDLARSWIGDPRQRARASMSLDLSRGLTLCLVKSREDARLDLDILSACVREIETINSVFEIAPGAGILAHPAC